MTGLADYLVILSEIPISFHRNEMKDLFNPVFSIGGCIKSPLSWQYF